jgi:uncharacterized protein (TIGR03067 family)
LRAVFVTLLMGLFLGVAVTAHADDKESAADKELKKLQGVWGTILDNYQHQEGFEAIAQPITELSKHRIQGNKWVNLDANGKPTGDEMTITLDPSTNPKQIRRTYTVKGEDGQAKQFTDYGIYKLEGDGLIVHWGLFDSEKRGGTKPAPKQFLEYNKPIKGVDGLATRYGRVKE